MKKNQIKAIVLGGSGFIGGHLITRLKKDGYHVTSIDIKKPEFKKTDADVFILHDLRNSLPNLKCDEIYQLAADMGGAGYVFSGDHDADIMINSAKINLNVANWIKNNKKTKEKILQFECSG
jgi:nucleoside-diphosphate-sugar epimerase